MLHREGQIPSVSLSYGLASEARPEKRFFMRDSKDRLFAALATAFWFGYSPIVPGTVGTLPAVAFFVLVETFAPEWVRAPVIAVALVASCVLSIALGSWAERFWGEKDPCHFVLDEVGGFLLTVLFFRGPDLLATVVWAFVTTRIFDVVKPWPAFRLQSLSGGWGILLDDLAASVYAIILLNVLWHFFPGLFVF